MATMQAVMQKLDITLRFISPRLPLPIIFNAADAKNTLPRLAKIILAPSRASKKGR